ncbi:Rhodanese-like protein [Hypomontagnella submonticulosa]|nr:Rhodanese-like protein [Hypomontagnella submonticulosa]
MATRRLATTVSAAALRGPSSRATTSVAAPRLLRASFGTTTSRIPRAPTTARTTSRPQLSRRNIPASVRWSSDTPPGTKIWSFEEVQAATSSPTSTPKITLIDVREPGELAQTGRIPGALNVPVSSAPDSFHLSAADFLDRYGFEPPSKEEGQVVFYCKAGVRSRAAATLAREAGYRNIGEYPGSWLDWVEKGGKIER